MNIAGPHSGDTSFAAPRSIRHAANSKLPALAVSCLAAALCLLAISWFLPADLSLLALDLMSWCLVGVLAAGTLFASVKLIENVLNF